MNIEHATPELFAALAKAQGEIENASKNAANPHFRSKYADLAEVMTTIRATLPKHGLSLIQSPHFDGSLALLDTLLAHAGGGYITDTASCVPAKTDAQGIGAATTYLRRYAAASMVGIHQEDDDGEAAAHGGKPAPISSAGQPMEGVWEGLDDAQREDATKAAAVIGEYAEGEDWSGAHEYIDGRGWSADMKVAVWSLLPSKTRTALKKIAAQMKEAA